MRRASAVTGLLVAVVGAVFVLVAVLRAPAPWVYWVGVGAMACGVLAIVGARLRPTKVAAGVGVAVLLAGLVAAVGPSRTVADVTETAVPGEARLVVQLDDLTYLRVRGTLWEVDSTGQARSLLPVGRDELVDVGPDWIVLSGGQRDDRRPITAYSTDGDERWERPAPEGSRAWHRVVAADDSLVVLVGCADGDCVLEGVDGSGESVWSRSVPDGLWRPGWEGTNNEVSGQVLADEVWLHGTGGQPLRGWTTTGDRVGTFARSDAFPAVDDAPTVLRTRSDDECLLRGLDSDADEVWRQTVSAQACGGESHYLQSGDILYLGDGRVAVDRVDGTVGTPDWPQENLSESGTGLGVLRVVWNEARVADPITGKELWRMEVVDGSLDTQAPGPRAVAAQGWVRTLNPYVARGTHPVQRGDVVDAQGSQVASSGVEGDVEQVSCLLPEAMRLRAALDEDLLLFDRGDVMVLVRCR